MSRPHPARSPRICLAVLALLAALWPTAALAHPLAPSLLQLDVRADQTVTMTWRTPMSRLVGTSLEPDLPAACRLVAPAATALLDDATALERRATYDCAPAGLLGQRVGVRDLHAAGTSAIVRLTWPDGHVVQSLLHAAAPTLTVPARQSTAAVAVAYGRLGLHHLLTGLDHVAFVLGLLLLVRGRRLVWAITAFTLGHSVTLALATLGLVQLSPPLVEIAIAASIVLVGLEAARAASAAPPGPIARHPAVLCAAFGLLHGLGFAGALAETGLPTAAIPLALFAFNLGIEAGQLAVVAAALSLLALAGAAARRARPGPPVNATAAAALATLVGTAGAYWCIDRLLRLAGLLHS